jgi:hypothetical protein
LRGIDKLPIHTWLVTILPATVHKRDMMG